MSAPDIDRRALAQLTQLRVEFPDWWFRLHDRTDLPWEAQRKYTPRWRGGFASVVAGDPQFLRDLLHQAAAVDARNVGRR